MRFAMLVVLAALIVGCDGARATPSRTAPPIASPSPAATPTATPAVTAVPTVTCPPEPSPAELVLQTGPGPESISLDPDPLATPEAIDPAEVPIVVTVLGGIDH